MQPHMSALLAAFRQAWSLLCVLLLHPHSMAGMAAPLLVSFWLSPLEDLWSPLVIPGAEGVICSPSHLHLRSIPTAGPWALCPQSCGGVPSERHGTTQFPNIEERVITHSLSGMWPGKVLVRLAWIIRLCYLQTVCCLKQRKDVPSFLDVIYPGQGQNIIWLLWYFTWKQ